MSISSLIRLFNNLRYSAGIAMMFNGFPIVFFIRDTLHIGPASNVFTAFFFALALILMFPTHLFTRLYKPNLTLIKYALLFIAIVLYHFFLFNNSGFDWFVEIGNIAFTLAFLFLIIHVPNDVKDTLIIVLFIFAFFSNLTLIYSLITDPNWKLGMRAAVTFENAGAQEGGNPHISARNGIICMLTGSVLAWKYNNILIKLFLIIAVIFSMAVIVLSQVKSALLAIALMIAFFAFYNANFTTIVKTVRSFFSVKSILLILLLILCINLFLSQYSNLYDTVYGYWFGFQSKILDVFYTAFGLKLTDTVSVDASAMGRVSSITYFLNAFADPALLIIGGGYKHIFMDVPILESMINHGIFGFIFFAGFNFYLFIYTIKELRRPSNSLTLFLAYFFIYFIVLLVSGGRPYDVSFWFPYVVFIRFLGIKYLDSNSNLA